MIIWLIHRKRHGYPRLPHSPGRCVFAAECGGVGESERKKQSEIMKTKTMMLLTLLSLGLSVGREAQAFYNPSTGRWLSRDPIGERGGKNLFGLVKNDSISNRDFLGKCVSTSGGSRRHADTLKFSYSGATTVVKVIVPDTDLCGAAGVDVKFDFGTSYDDMDEGRLQGWARFTCNGKVTPFTDYGSGGGSDDPEDPYGMSKHWQVTCHLPLEKCHSTVTGVTLGMAAGDTGQPMEDIATANASINYSCKCPCATDGCTKVQISGNQIKKD